MQALENGSSSAAAVAREGVLFAGETSIPLQSKMEFRRVENAYKRVPQRK